MYSSSVYKVAEAKGWWTPGTPLDFTKVLSFCLSLPLSLSHTHTYTHTHTHTHTPHPPSLALSVSTLHRFASFSSGTQSFGISCFLKSQGSGYFRVLHNSGFRLFMYSEKNRFPENAFWLTQCHPLRTWLILAFCIGSQLASQ